MVWYIEKNGEARKIPEEVLKYKIENNEISGDNLAVNEEIKNWVPLRETQLWKETVKASPVQNGWKPDATHTWRCEKCGNMISETPCRYCSDQMQAQTDASVKNITQNSTPHVPRHDPWVVFSIILPLFILVVICVNMMWGKKMYVAKLPDFNAATIQVDGYLHKDRECCQKVADYFDAEVIAVRTKDKAGTNEIGQTNTYEQAFSFCPLCN